MKKLLLFLALIVGFITTKAQENPFAEFGYTPKVATLSQGQFNESFDNDTIVQIGSILFNTKSKQIVAFVEYDTLYSEATLEPDIVSRWMSPDPLADHPNQIGLSPYQYGWNNPIYWTDPDGRCPLCPWADAIIDIGFALYDVGEIVYDYTTTGEVDPISVAALTADLGAIAVPMTTGAGLAVRGTAKAAKAATTVHKIEKASDIAKATYKMAKNGSWSKTAYRHNLQKATGKVAKGFDAHHTLPKADDMADFFKRADIDVNDPKNLIWRESKSHQGKNSADHLKMWRDFMKKNPNADKDQILKQRDLIEKKVWGNTKGDTPTS